MKKAALAMTKHVHAHIHVMRGQRVILDSDLAELYGVAVKHLNQQVKRNRNRFPQDFVFRTTAKDVAGLRSQIVTSKNGRGGRRYSPYAFTEHGAIMAATVLNSKRATQMSVFVVRAFVRMREMLAATPHVAAKLAELETRLKEHDVHIEDIVRAIRQLLAPPETHRRQRKIGFQLPPTGERSLRMAAGS